MQIVEFGEMVKNFVAVRVVAAAFLFLGSLNCWADFNWESSRAVEQRQKTPTHFIVVPEFSNFPTDAYPEMNYLITQSSLWNENERIMGKVISVDCESTLPGEIRFGNLEKHSEIGRETRIERGFTILYQMRDVLGCIRLKKYLEELATIKDPEVLSARHPIIIEVTTDASWEAVRVYHQEPFSPE